MTRFLLRSGILLLLTVAAWFALARMKLLPDPLGLLKGRPLRIDDTPMKVTGIRELAELFTLKAEDEVVADTVRVDPAMMAVRSMTGIGPSADRLVIIARGTVIMGTDLKRMEEGDLVQVGDSVSLSIPAATVIEVTVNPSGVRTFMERGAWPPEAVEAVKMKARGMMRMRALEQGLLGKANARAIATMEQFLRQCGFKKVSVRLKP